MSSKVFTVAGLTLAKCPDTKRLLRPRKSNSYDQPFTLGTPMENLALNQINVRSSRRPRRSNLQNMAIFPPKSQRKGFETGRAALRSAPPTL